VGAIHELGRRFAGSKLPGPKKHLRKPVFSGALRRVVCGTDRILRAFLGIHEFSQDRGCILRVAKVRWPHPVCLRDGTQLRAGECVGDLHLWNERLGHILGRAKSLATGARFRTEVRNSLASLAVFIAIEPEMRDVTAFHARVYRAVRLGKRDRESALARQGFSVFERQASFLGRAHDFFELFLIRALLWVFNPQRPSRSLGHVRRFDIWISRKQLLVHFAPRCVPSPPEESQESSGVKRESDG
jgi:hypothetical protein